MRGGSWNSTGPAFSPRSAMRSSSSASELAAVGSRRFQCVMNFDAFQAKRKPGGVPSRQPATASCVGVR
jgi:hypothetical protein